MKTRLSLTGLFMLVMLTGAMAQKKEKFKIYLDMEKNGEKVIVDTSFATREAMESYMESMGINTELPEPPMPPAPPELPELRRMPEPPALPDMEKIMIEVEKANLSEAEKAEIKQEMENAKLDMEKADVEMKKANVEMEKARKEMKANEKEMEKARKEMKRIRIQSEDSDKTGQQYYIHLNDNISEGKQKVVIVEVAGDGDDSQFEYRIFKMPCDSVQFWKTNADSKDEGNIRVIKKISRDDSPMVIIDEDEPSEVIISRSPSKTESIPNNQENELTASTSVSVPSPVESYKLEASDFKLYPNPTQGKINISFKLEQSGPVQVRLLDASGKVLVDEMVAVSDGYFNKEYSVENKSKGVYLLQLKQGDKWRHEKVIVK